jgi:hypothetical protein
MISHIWMKVLGAISRPKEQILGYFPMGSSGRLICVLHTALPSGSERVLSRANRREKFAI